ncbi:membrane protein [Mycobacterium tuberculosis]|nr:membrane protein [Mycobacterium tuberculosis]
MRRHLGPWRLSCGRQRGTQSQQFTPVSFGEDGGQDQLWWNSGWRRRSDAGNHITSDPVGHLLA